MRLVWDDISGNPSTGGDDLEDAAKIALFEVLAYGRLRRTLRMANWKKGLMGKLSVGDDVLRAMQKVGMVSKIDISGVSEGGLVMEMDSIGAVQQFMDNGQITGVLRKLFSELRS